MKKTKKIITPGRLTQSRVKLTFLDQTSLPLEKAVTVMAILAGVSERAVRRQMARQQAATVNG